jgi:hypothetical protein
MNGMAKSFVQERLFVYIIPDSFVAQQYERATDLRLLEQMNTTSYY